MMVARPSSSRRGTEKMSENATPTRISGTISKFDGDDYIEITLSDGEIEFVNTKDWITAHGKPTVGMKIEKCFKNDVDPYFGIRHYGFVPAGFHEKGWG